MSNIYEALEQAQREKNDSEIQSLVSIPENSPVQEEVHVQRVARKPAVTPMEAEMFSLYQSIDYLLPGISKKTILFVSPQGGEGVSTVVREFARMAAVKLDKTVLIMDAAHHNPSQHLYFNIKGGYGWKDVGKGEPADKACHQASTNNLFLSPIAPQTAVAPCAYDHTSAIGFLEGLKNKYELILIDSSPATISPESVAISRFADGVVLVIEAERTRRQVIESVKSRIERNGGNVLGIVFNKRRYYIPEFIYKRLR
jgi:protein-tyrosine kinase